MKNYLIESKSLDLKYGLLNFYNKNKWIILSLSLVLIIALLTGVFTSIKLYKLDSDLDLKEYSIYALLNGSLYTFKYVLLRILSICIVSILLYVCALSKWLYILGVGLLVYRAFLIALNCALVVVKYGINGLFFSLIIICICQILILLLLALQYVVFINMIQTKKVCGSILWEDKNKLVWIFILLAVASILQLIILYIFKATTLLII